MSGREWRPGDVAALRSRDGAEVRALWQGNQWATQNGHYLSHWQVTARPLVVIDAEDREQAGRLLDMYTECVHSPVRGDDEPDDWRTDRMQAALREFANPTPPKPAEPTGLGAVVEAAAYSDEIRTFVRGPGSRSPWFDSSGNGHEWNELDLDRIVAEGVEA